MSRSTRANDKDALLRWEAYRDNLRRATPVPSESEAEKRQRIEQLEAHPEQWFSFYFPNYYSSEPADFHKRATRRILKNYKRWYEVRAWSRELAKSTRTFMEVMYLTMTGKMGNVLLVSHNYDNACELMMPYMIQLESNDRLINDYGLQKGLRNWEVGKFVTRQGASFRALGSGQSPRGTRNEEKRPDIIIIDDIDTDEKARNIKRVDDTWKWIERALIPAMSVAGNKLIIFCGNIIGKDTVIVRAAKVSDYYEKINIRDSKGLSSWPQKNSEADIDYILSKISYTSAQQEYFNTPITEGTVFKEMHWRKLPPLTAYPFLVAYGDPSFKDTKKNDYKAVVLMGKWRNEYHIIKAFVEQTTTARMADWYMQLKQFVGDKTNLYLYIEGNMTQDLIVQQVKKHLAEAKAGFTVAADYRKKGDKFSRIESALEPLNRNGQLWMNQTQQKDAHMMRLEDQFLALEPKLSAHDDGPDAAEGAKWIIDSKTAGIEQGILIQPRGQGAYRNKKRF